MGPETMSSAPSEPRRMVGGAELPSFRRRGRLVQVTVQMLGTPGETGWRYAFPAIPTIGLLRVWAPVEPKKPASP